MKNYKLKLKIETVDREKRGQTKEFPKFFYYLEVENPTMG
jgi:hypothetical protein